MKRDQLPIAEPCNADWDGMDSRGAARFCDSCAKSVHDLSAMTEREATALLTQETNLCVRYTHTPDGRIKHRSETPSMLERGLRNGLRIGLGLTLVAGGPVFASTAARATEGDSEPGVVEMALELLESLLEEASPMVMMGEPMVIAPEELVVMGDLAYEPEEVTPVIEVEISEPREVLLGRVAYEPPPELQTMGQAPVIAQPDPAGVGD